MLAGTAIGSVIRPPKPVTKPETVHFVICAFINVLAALFLVLYFMRYSSQTFSIGGITEVMPETDFS